MVPRAGDTRRILTIIGPTAVGKTAVALAVARALDGEIVSADSRQVYRGMDIGTAKPTDDERAAVPHHLIDVVEPRERYDAARFAHDAEEAIAEILTRGKEPLVVGGTGFYLSSLFSGLFLGPGRDEELREELAARASAEGLDALHGELRAVDPVSAERIHPNDSARVIRALEVYLTTEKPLSEWQGDATREPRFAGAYLGLTMERAALYERIDARVNDMIERGLVDEIRSLLRSGRLAPGMPASTAVGYRELIPVAEAGPERIRRAVDEVKKNTRRYAKRQLTWFASLEGAHWIDVGEAGVDGTVRKILAGWAKK